jgi:hypothetical protein
MHGMGEKAPMVLNLLVCACVRTMPGKRVRIQMQRVWKTNQIRNSCKQLACIKDIRLACAKMRALTMEQHRGRRAHRILIDISNCCCNGNVAKIE